MRMDKMKIVLFGLFLLLFVYVYFSDSGIADSLKSMQRTLTSDINQLTQSLDNFKNATTNNLNVKQQELDNLKASLQNLNETLNSTVGRMGNVESDIAAAEEKIRVINDALNETRGEYSAMQKDIQTNQEELSDRLTWLKNNSLLPQSIASFYGRATGVCASGSRLNLACVHFYMKEDLGFVYRQDNSDELYAINTMVGRKGGDCEDFSVFLKAFLTSFKANGGDELYGWENGDQKFTIATTGGGYWYYPNAKEHIFGSMANFYPYVVCYTTIPKVEGHCVVALSKSLIGDVNQTRNLNGSEVFEPQSGKYLGVVGTNFEVCGKGDNNCVERVDYFYIIIGEDDLFNFYNGEWNSFQNFNSRLTNMYGLVDDRISMLNNALSNS